MFNKEIEWFFPSLPSSATINLLLESFNLSFAFQLHESVSIIGHSQQTIIYTTLQINCYEI